MATGQTPDPLLKQIEQELRPGSFIPYSHMSGFTRHLGQVEKKLRQIIGSGEAERAVRLYEVFLAGCYEKLDECDDSDGYLGSFWQTLFCGWVAARQAAGCSAADTVHQILMWDENDDYGICYNIEKEAVKVLDPEGYEMFVAHFRKALDDGLTSLQDAKPGAIFEYADSVRLPAISLKNIYQTMGDVVSYAALCERIGLSPKDCARLAEMEKAKGRWQQALAWVEKGLELEPTRAWHNEEADDLEEMKPEILGRLGRKKEALALLWDDFEQHPSEFGYKNFMLFVPKRDKARWHERAMKVAAAGSLGAFMGLCVNTGEWRLLAARVQAAKDEDLEEVSHYYSEEAAEGLAKHDASAAVRLYRAMGFRILNSKKSKYYGSALAHFEKVRELCPMIGAEADWRAIVATIREKHSRKHGFMPGFERIVSGESAHGPSFLERAQKRWRKQTGGEES
jgi:tetratricopeptide (TPR) repeat protein